MRLRLQTTTRVRQLEWRNVLAPGRGIAYTLLEAGAPDLAESLHSHGAGAHGMVPFGHGAPVFPEAVRRKGVYAAGGRGYVEFGSPVPEVLAAWAKGTGSFPMLDWGGSAFHIENVEVLQPPEFAAGVARFRTVTPVVMKGSGRGEDGERTTRQAWLFPQDAEYLPYMTQNLRRKAETLGLDTDVTVERVLWAGTVTKFFVKGGVKPGARVEVVVRGAPETLQAVWSWGLGQATSAGFGWVQA